MKSPMSEILDLGAGKNPAHPQALTVDNQEHNNPDVLWDLNDTPYPFNNDQFDRVYLNHVLEHLDNWKDCLREVHRITETGGAVSIQVPHYSVSIRSPDHNNHFSLRSFNELFNPEDSMFVADFEIKDRSLLWAYKGHPSWKSRLTIFMNPLVDGCLRPYFDVYLWPFIGGINEITINLEPVKNG